MVPAGFETAIPTSEWLQIHALDCAAPEIVSIHTTKKINLYLTENTVRFNYKDQELNVV
jgi:hypothetical protein